MTGKGSLSEAHAASLSRVVQDALAVLWEVQSALEDDALTEANLLALLQRDDPWEIKAATCEPVAEGPARDWKSASWCGPCLGLADKLQEAGRDAAAVEIRRLVQPVRDASRLEVSGRAESFNPLRKASIQAVESLIELLEPMGRCFAGGTSAEKPEHYVKLSQAAAVVSRSKRTLEGWQRDDPDFPLPDVQGTGGRASEWAWSRLRPYLEKRVRRELPDRFPADPFRPDWGAELPINGEV